MSEVRSLLAEATARLASAGVPSPRVDAELLLAARLGVSRGRLITRESVPEAVRGGFADDLRRRIAREPLQHITGTAAFRHLVLHVGPGVFVPRPETELLVDAVLAHLRALDRPTVVDLCAGSGALALAVADEVPGAAVTAVEKAPAALRWLERNAEGSGVQVVAGDVADAALLRSRYGRVDAVLSNPPYVPTATAVAPEVAADPAEAVFGGADGLGLIPTVVQRAALLLRPGGRFAMEHDDTHAEAVPALLRARPEWTDVAEHHDLAGAPRYVTATRR